MKSFQQASFNPISSDLSLGAPIADISRGWDGTLWAIDTAGAPHLYDPTNKIWNAYGTGIDAACWHKGNWLLFRGNETYYADGKQAGSQLISDQFPALPKSFQLGVRGAANVSGRAYLFKSGLYVPADGAQPPKALTEISGWPQTQPWRDGVIDVVGSGNGSDGQVIFIRQGEFLIVDFDSLKVIGGPAGLDVGYGAPATALLNTGAANALLYNGSVSNVTTPLHLFAGVALHSLGAGNRDPNPMVVYMGANSGWPQTWHPVLAHAPNGRAINLWSAMRNGQGLVYYDGAQWNVLPGNATYAAVGQDNSVFAIGAGQNSIWQWQGANSWSPIGNSAPATLAQASAGDAKTVWLRDTGNNVYTLDTGSGAYTQLAAVGQAIHLAASYDGSVWHCNGDPRAYRFAGGTSASDQLAVPQGTVQKVASTGFGNSHCLTSVSGGNQLYEYTSPFVYKSAPGYELPGKAAGQIAEGLGRIFFVQQIGFFDPNMPDFQSYVVAADSQTGQQIWETPVPWKNCLSTAPVFDARLNLVYFGLAVVDPDDATNPGAMIALDAQTGAIVWSIQTRASSHPGMCASIDCAPALLGNLLCFGDRQGYLHGIDTDAAFQHTAESAKWSLIGQLGSGRLRVSTPAIVNGFCYFYTYSSGDCAFYVQRCVAADGSGLTVPAWRALGVPAGEYPDLWPPVFGKASFATGTDALFVQACNEVHAVNLSVGPDGELAADLGFTLEPNVTFTSGLAYLNRTLWVGDSEGRIHALNSAFQHVNATPHQVSAPGMGLVSIAAYEDAGGNTAVFCAARRTVKVGEGGSLFAFDAANAVVELIPTGESTVWALGSVNTNGVLPAAGQGSSSSFLGPVFGIRVDQVISSLRAFVIESQLLQDYDETTPGLAPTAVARYQTHVTLVDNFKVPCANETVKIWADKAGTAIIVGGTTYTIGPDDASFASVQTAVDGTLTILSDASQLYATSLRLWTGFMDPYERISICPDQEFHGRLLKATADSTSNDPSKINLSTAHAYTQWKPDGNGGTSPVSTQPLLTGGQPTQVAGAIQKFGGASGVGLTPLSATKHHRFSGRLGETPPKYCAYDDLNGQGYSPVNVALRRLAQKGPPTGFSFGTRSGVVALSPAQAAAAIDALAGNEWQSATAMLGSPHLIGGFWDDFWDFCCNAVETVADAVANVVVSVAEDIYVGVQVIVNGVETVFRAIVHTIEDAVKAIGSFFLKIGKLIKDVIEALSLLFHFEEIIKVHNLIRNSINSGLTASLSFLTTKAKPAVDQFFSTAEADVINGFNQWKQALQSLNATERGTSNNSLMSLTGAGSTPHTIFSVTPKGGGSKQSHSVQAMWGINKMKGNCKHLSIGASQSSLAGSADPITAFAQGFMQSLENNQGLKNAYSGTLSDFQRTFNFSSPAQFLSGSLVDLIDILEDIVVAGSALAEAMLDGIITAAVAMIQEVQAGLNYRIEIPLLSSLYQMLTGNPLTLLDLGCLMLAIPVTLIYTIVDGDFPAVPNALGADPGDIVAKRVLGLVDGIAYVPYGIITAAADLWSGAVTNFAQIPALGYIGNALGSIMWVVRYPNWIESSSVEAQDVVAWLVGIQKPLFWSLLAKPEWREKAEPGDTEALPILRCIGALGSIAADIVQKCKDSSEDWITLTGKLGSTLPGLASPLMIPSLAESTLGASLAIKIAIDFIGNFASAACIIGETVIKWAPSAKLEQRVAFA